MLTAIIVIVALAGGFAGGFLYRKKVSEKEISSAEEEGRRIVNEAIRNAESKKKEALLEAKEEILKSRTDYEKEEKSRRADLQRQENRLQQKEENLDRKLETIEKKEESLAQKHAAMEKEQEEIRTIKQSQTAMLEKISGFTDEMTGDENLTGLIHHSDRGVQVLLRPIRGTSSETWHCHQYDGRLQTHRQCRCGTYQRDY